MPDEIKEQDEHEDYLLRPEVPIKLSERHEVANQVPLILEENGIESPMPPIRDEKGRYYYVPFTVDRILGEVRIYGKDYFCVIWTGCENKRLGNQGTRFFDGPERVGAFLSLAFVNGLVEQALAVPERVHHTTKRSTTKLDRPNNWIPDVKPGFFGEGNP